MDKVNYYSLLPLFFGFFAANFTTLAAQHLLNQMVQDWSDKKILVAEDEFIGKKYLEKILSFQNAKVYFANNGEEAVEAVRNEDFDMILMDLKMPVKNGFDATREIKQMRPKIPVIAQTALAFPADKARAEESGCDDFIIKPIIRNELIAKISRLFEQPLLEFN